MSFFCHRCGEVWEKHPATVVACPDCKANPGAVCKRPSGHNVTRGEVHVAREAAAVASGLLPICKGSQEPVPKLDPIAVPVPMVASSSQMSISF